MDRKLNQDEFEQFLKASADDLRMRPSAFVWDRVAGELNKKKRRFVGFFVLALTFFSGGAFTWVLLNLQKEPTTAINFITVQQSANQATAAAPAAPLPAKSTTPAATNFLPKNEASTFFLKTRTQPTTSLLAENAPAAATGNEAESLKDLAPILRSDTAVFFETAHLPAAPVQTEKAGISNSLSPELTAATPQQVSQPEITPEAQINAASAAAAIPLPKKKSRLNWSVFVTPTVSYRKLSENKAFDRPFLTPGTPPTVSALYNINNAVMHKPDLGLEFGTMVRYAVSRNFRLRTGFQFNISRYDIRAFSFVPEVATITLSNGFGVDSVRAVTNYRNFNGGGSNWLQNFYFQASMPLGMELKLAGNRNVEWNVASSIQPTYVIGNRSYMITADYKNYARVPWLTRRWNMNTSVETFVSIRSGKTEWHVGPQVRYQVLSSFVKKYPVKENLFDYGVKLGITLK